MKFYANPVVAEDVALRTDRQKLDTNVAFTVFFLQAHRKQKEIKVMNAANIAKIEEAGR